MKWWIDILLEANYKPKTVVLDGHTIVCGRGECAVSVLSWSKRWLVDRGKVRRFLELLQKHEMVTVKGTEKTTLISVCKYDSYQSLQPTTGQQPANNRPQHNKETRKQEYNTDIQIGEQDMPLQPETLKTGSGKTRALGPAPGPDVSTLIALPFGSAFKEKWAEWVQYRKGRKKPYKTTKGVETVLRKIVQLSGNNENKAVELIEYALGREWLDIFAIPNNQTQKNGTVTKDIGKNISFDRA